MCLQALVNEDYKFIWILMKNCPEYIEVQFVILCRYIKWLPVVLTITSHKHLETIFNQTACYSQECIVSQNIHFCINECNWTFLKGWHLKNERKELNCIKTVIKKVLFVLEFPRSHHFGLYEGMWLSLLSSDRSSFWHTSPGKEHADNDDNHYTLYIQHGDTHTQFQIKTANICFHFFSCTKYKNYNVSSF